MQHGRVGLPDPQPRRREAKARSLGRLSQWLGGRGGRSPPKKIERTGGWACRMPGRAARECDTTLERIAHSQQEQASNLPSCFYQAPMALGIKKPLFLYAERE